MLKDEASAHAPHLVVVQNWATELRRLVPKHDLETAIPATNGHLQW